MNLLIDLVDLRGSPLQSQKRGGGFLSLLVIDVEGTEGEENHLDSAGLSRTFMAGAFAGPDLFLLIEVQHLFVNVHQSRAQGAASPGQR